MLFKNGSRPAAKLSREVWELNLNSPGPTCGFYSGTPSVGRNERHRRLGERPHQIWAQEKTSYIEIGRRWRPRRLEEQKIAILSSRPWFSKSCSTRAELTHRANYQGSVAHVPPQGLEFKGNEFSTRLLGLWGHVNFSNLLCRDQGGPHFCCQAFKKRLLCKQSMKSRDCPFAHLGEQLRVCYK